MWKLLPVLELLNTGTIFDRIERKLRTVLALVSAATKIMTITYDAAINAYREAAAATAGTGLNEARPKR